MDIFTKKIFHLHEKVWIYSWTKYSISFTWKSLDIFTKEKIFSLYEKVWIYSRTKSFLYMRNKQNLPPFTSERQANFLHRRCAVQVQLMFCVVCLHQFYILIGQHDCLQVSEDTIAETAIKCTTSFWNIIDLTRFIFQQQWQGSEHWSGANDFRNWHCYFMEFYVRASMTAPPLIARLSWPLNHSWPRPGLIVWWLFPTSAYCAHLDSTVVCRGVRGGACWSACFTTPTNLQERRYNPLRVRHDVRASSSTQHSARELYAQWRSQNTSLLIKTDNKILPELKQGSHNVFTCLSSFRTSLRSKVLELHLTLP